MRSGVRVLAGLAPAVLLAVDPGGWYPFGPIKWLLASTLALGGAALVLPERSVQVPRPLALALAGFVAWLAVAAAVGEDPLYAWIGTPERHLGVLTWVICALLLVTGTALSERDGRTVVDGLLAAGLGVGAMATAEALGWEPAVLDVADRLSGSVGSPAYLGAAAALLLPICAATALAARPTPASSRPPESADDVSERRDAGWGWGRAVAAVVASGLLLVALVGSGARAAWVGVAAALVVVVAARGSHLWARVRADPRRSVALGAGAALAAVLVVVLSPVGARIADATDPGAAGGRGRLDEWRVATRVVADHPLTGVGPEGYRTVFEDGVDDAYERAHGREQQPDRAHSGPLDVALAGGLPLLAAWVAVLAVVARAAWRALRRGPAWQQGIAAALVAHWVGQLLLFPVVELEPVAWLLAGLLVTTTTGAGQPRRVVPGWVGAGLGVLAVVAGLAGVTDVVADRRADRAVAALERGDTRSAVVAADAAADLRPDIVRLHLLAARAAVADAQGALGGLQRVDDALAVSPRDPIARRERLRLLVQRAESTLTRDHLQVARVELGAALRDDPHSAALWRLDARLAAAEGDAAAAARATARADALTPPEDRR